MVRLIDADHFKQRVMPKCQFPISLEFEVDSEPTVDAVPVVRCKDCKHRPLDSYEAPTGEDGLADDVCPYICMTDNWYTGIPDDDSFCDKGELKDGEHD